MDRREQVKKIIGEKKNKTCVILSSTNDGSYFCGIGANYQRFPDVVSAYQAIPSILERVDGVFFRGRMIENVRQWKRLDTAFMGRDNDINN